VSSNRPNTISILRRVDAGRSQTRSQLTNDVTLNASVPALLQGARSATTTIEVEGKEYLQDALLIVDGLSPSAYRGLAPRDTVVVKGVTYTVLPNRQGAFPDLAANDVVIDETGQRSLVLAVNPYLMSRTLQAQLARGKAWT